MKSDSVYLTSDCVACVLLSARAKSRRYWTPAEDALLRAMYPHCHTADIAAWIGRTQRQCYQHAAALGLRKDPEYLASDAACRIQRGKQNAAMIASRIQPGAEPWNKGRKGLTGVQEACRRTQFKPGSKPQTWVAVGSYRITDDGTLEQKLNDLPGPSKVRWFPVHRTVWESVNGPIPKGCIVVFKPRQRTTDPALITVDRLECISRIDNMRRNSVHTNYPPEVARLVQLRGALNRQINRRQEQQA